MGSLSAIAKSLFAVQEIERSSNKSRVLFAEEKSTERTVESDYFLRPKWSVLCRVGSQFRKSVSLPLLIQSPKKSMTNASPAIGISTSSTLPVSPSRWRENPGITLYGQDLISWLLDATPCNYVDVPEVLNRVRYTLINEHRQKHLHPVLAKSAYTILLKAKEFDEENIDVEFWLGIAARRASSFFSCIDKQNRPHFEKLSFVSIIEYRPESLYNANPPHDTLSPEVGFPYWEVLAKRHLEKASNLSPEDKNVCIHYTAAIRDLCKKYKYARLQYWRRMHPDVIWFSEFDIRDANILAIYGCKASYCTEGNADDIFMKLVHASEFSSSRSFTLGMIEISGKANNSVPFLNYRLMHHYWAIKLEYYNYRQRDGVKKVPKRECMLMQQRSPNYAEVQEIAHQLIKLDPYSPALLAVESLKDKHLATHQISPREIKEASLSFFFSGCLARQDDQITVETRIEPTIPLKSLEHSKLEIGSIAEE